MGTYGPYTMVLNQVKAYNLVQTIGQLILQKRLNYVREPSALGD
jgi:hypothetical protein